MQLAFDEHTFFMKKNSGSLFTRILSDYVAGLKNSLVNLWIFKG